MNSVRPHSLDGTPDFSALLTNPVGASAAVSPPKYEEPCECEWGPSNAETLSVRPLGQETPKTQP